MQLWINRHKTLLGKYAQQIELLEIHNYDQSLISDAVKIFGGGEVLTDKETFLSDPYKPLRSFALKVFSKYFARSGWNYAIKYRSDILQGNFIVL